MSNDVAKQEAKSIIRNYTRTPNILFDDYSELHPQEKWLFINLVYLCGARGTRYLSVRYIAQRTGISAGALSGSKDPNKNNPGMIRNLHNAGLIHAEKKKPRNQDGTTKGQEQYHITITDIWQLNEDFFIKRSENEHSNNEGVRNVNASVQEMNSLEGERSENERERSEFDTNIRLHSNTTVTSKITDKQEDTYSRDFASAQHDAPTPLSLQDQIATLQQQLEALLSQQPASEFSTPTEDLSPESVDKSVQTDNNPSVPLQASEQSYSRTTTPPTTPEPAQPPSEKPEEQPILIERPKIPAMPPVSMKVSGEKIVQITEALIGKYYPETRRQKQIAAARRILQEGITEEQYITAYTDIVDWWKANQGTLHVFDMAANTKRGQMRVLEITDKIEARQKPVNLEEKRKDVHKQTALEHGSRPTRAPMTADEIRKTSVWEGVK